MAYIILSVTVLIVILVLSIIFDSPGNHDCKHCKDENICKNQFSVTGYNKCNRTIRPK